MSYLIGKSKAPYSIGKALIKQAALAMVKAMCGEEASKKLTTVPLSNNTVQRRMSKVLWYVKVENKEFAFLPILNRSIEDLNPEPDLMTSVLFVILEDLHTPRKKFKKYNLENINFCTWIKNLFSTNVADFDAGFPFGFQEQLIDLKKDSSMKLSFGELSLPKF